MVSCFLNHGNATRVIGKKSMVDFFLVVSRSLCIVMSTGTVISTVILRGWL